MKRILKKHRFMTGINTGTGFNEFNIYSDIIINFGWQFKSGYIFLDFLAWRKYATLYKLMEIAKRTF